MKRGYTLRFATVRDLAALVQLEQTAFQTDLFTRDQIEYFLTRSRATNLVIEYKDKVVASACVLWRKEHRGARLYNLAVDPAFQGKGLGLILMKECELEAARRECQLIVLEVREDNEGAKRFYERLGYSVRRLMPDYYHDGTAGYKMYKELNRPMPAKLKHKVPYYHQTLDFTCGPACLMMALKYFYPLTELNRTLEMNIWKEATLIFMASGYAGTDGFGLSLSARKRGLGSRLIMSMDTTPLLRSVRSQKKRDVMKIVHNDMKRQVRMAGIGSAIFDYGIDEITASIRRGWLPIAMISTYRLTGDRVPHWVVVTGFDRDHVYIHDPDIDSYSKNSSRARNIRIERSEFLKMTRYGKEVYRCLLLVGQQATK